jgi:hypothetical protein
VAVRGGRLDAILWTYLVGELIVMVLLCLSSTGAWFNYSVQAMVFAAALLGRSLARLGEGAGGWRRALLVIGALAIPIAEIPNVVGVVAASRGRQKEARLVFDRIGEPAGSVYFAGDPGANRLYGRRELVIDDWLYPVFESVRQAEPRSVWLRRALAEGPVRAIVTTSRDPHVPGVGEPITDFGYRPAFFGGRHLYVWRRPGPLEQRPAPTGSR